MKYIDDVVAALNAQLATTPLADFYGRRFALKGKGYRHTGLFQKPRDGGEPFQGYAYHRGGRGELQFNIGFEEERFFRYGVAFSLQTGQDLPDPVAALSGRIDTFNAVVSDFPVLHGLQLWWYRNRNRFEEGPVTRLPTRLIQNGTFIFMGERVDVSNSGVTPAIIGRAVEVLVSLLPLYERIEGHGQDHVPAHAGGKTAISSDDMPQYIARLAFNSQRWSRPTHAAEVQESGDSYRTAYGFGHEDWLFRNEWLLDGWRYGFVQGVNKSRKKLLKQGQPFHLRLFVMRAPGDRRAVAEIREVECLTDELAAAAVAAYEDRGWLDKMRAEVAEASGRVEALGHDEYAPFILNLRYRLDNVRWLDADTPLPADDPIHNIKRYSLCQIGGAMDSALPAWRGRSGTTELPSTDERRRFVQGGWTTYSPEHIRMQSVLVEQLREQYPGAEIICERDFVDVMVRTNEEILLFEVKSDLHPLSVVRQALGQVLEYAFHPRRTHDLPLRLVIVGRRPLEGGDLAYFEQLRERFSLPLTYQAISI